MPADGGPFLAPENARHTDAYFRSHLGASEWAAAIGLDPWKTPIELYEEKVGLRARQPPTVATKLGQALEAGVLTYAKEKLGVSGAPCGTLEVPGARHFCVTPDNLLVDGDLMQGKTTALTNPIPRRIIDERWGVGGDLVPEHTLVQCCAELWGARRALAHTDTMRLAARGLINEPVRLPERDHVAALIPGREDGVCLFVIEWSEVAKLAETFSIMASAFWLHVIEQKPPPPDASVAYSQHLARMHPKPRAEWVDGDSMEWSVLAARLRDADEALDAAQAERDLVANECRAAIGGAAGARGEWGEIPWTLKRGKRETDVEAYARSLHGFLAERFAVDGLLPFDEIADLHRGVAWDAVVERLETSARLDAKATAKELDAIREACSTRGEPSRSFGPATWK